jgi:uroporphyrin-III C-methyltransferase
LHSDHTVSTLPRAAMLHAGRPTVVTVGAGAQALSEVKKPRTAGVMSAGRHSTKP